MPHICSSATLYDEEVINKRKSWFEEWLVLHPAPTQDEIMRFHQFTGDGESHNDLLMNPDGKVFTVSITSALIRDDKIRKQYLAVKETTKVEKQFPISN